MNKTFIIACLASFCAVIGYANCGPDEFRGSGTGKTEEEALSVAYSSLARQIHSSVKVSEKYTQGQKVSGGNELLNSEYTSKMTVESSLTNAHDARVLLTMNVGKVDATVCMSRSNAAKGFAEHQSLVADSLEIAAHSSLGTQHPKLKNEAWQRTHALWNEFARLQGILDGFGAAKADFFDTANEIYAKAREEHIAYCQNSKLHWTPAQENNYSELALSKLSRNLKMEKSACKDKGISLVYKNHEPECSQKFGLYSCSYKPSLSVVSCEGTEYQLLENSVEAAHQKQDFALEKLQSNLKTANFWEKWEREIKEWSLQCK